VTFANGNPHLMRTLPRNGSPKHDAGPQVSDKSRAGCGTPWKSLWRTLAAVLVLAAAAAGRVMPPKSTYFYPKLVSGLLFHPL